MGQTSALNFPVIKRWGVPEVFDDSGLQNSSTQNSSWVSCHQTEWPVSRASWPLPRAPCEDVASLAPSWCTSTCCQHSTGSNDIWKKCPQNNPQSHEGSEMTAWKSDHEVYIYVYIYIYKCTYVYIYIYEPWFMQQNDDAFKLDHWIKTPTTNWSTGNSNHTIHTVSDSWTFVKYS